MIRPLVERGVNSATFPFPRLTSRHPGCHGHAPSGVVTMNEPAASRRSFPVVRDNAPVPPALRGCIMAIGNFDGVHRGHRVVINSAIAAARAVGRKAVALTFEPHT